MSSTLPVAIIGAGPYGLSVAAHLGRRGIDYRIFGKPMSAWQENMPPGMFLKSDGYASDLSDPDFDMPLAAFCAAQRLPYHPTLVPVPLETFAAYGLSFQTSLVPRVEAKRLVRLSRAASGLRLRFDDGESLIAQRVVIAVGAVPFRHIPQMLGRLPAELASHSSDYGPLDRFAGREVAILGAGSSALDLAALLHEKGASVTLLTRRLGVKFHGSPHEPRTLRQKLRPPSKIGPGWKLRLCDEAPQLIHLLPERYRLEILRRTLGPAGGYFIRDKVVGRVTLKCGYRVGSADACGGRIRIQAIEANGVQEILERDHLIMATGYKVDLRRLDVLDDDVVAALRLVDGAPALTGDYESSVPGLHFVGLTSAVGFGPVMRFVAGAAHPARRLSRLFPKALLTGAVRVPALAQTARSA